MSSMLLSCYFWHLQHSSCNRNKMCWSAKLFSGLESILVTLRIQSGKKHGFLTCSEVFPCFKHLNHHIAIKFASSMLAVTEVHKNIPQLTTIQHRFSADLCTPRWGIQMRWNMHHQSLPESGQGANRCLYMEHGNCHTFESSNQNN